MAKRFVFTRSGKPVVVTVGSTKIQIPGGYSEHESAFIESVMSTPQGKDIIALDDKASDARRIELKKAENAKAEAEKAAKKAKSEDLKKMQEALRLNDITIANNERNGKIKALKDEIINANDAIASYHADIKHKEAELAKITKQTPTPEPNKEENKEENKKKDKKGGK